MPAGRGLAGQMGDCAPVLLCCSVAACSSTLPLYHACSACLLPLPFPYSLSCAQVDGIGNLVELNGRFAAELDSPVLMVRPAAWLCALLCCALLRPSSIHLASFSAAPSPQINLLSACLPPPCISHKLNCTLPAFPIPSSSFPAFKLN